MPCETFGRAGAIQSDCLGHGIPFMGFTEKLEKHRDTLWLLVASGRSGNDLGVPRKLGVWKDC